MVLCNLSFLSDGINKICVLFKENQFFLLYKLQKHDIIKSSTELMAWHCGCSVASDPDCMDFTGYCRTY